MKVENRVLARGLHVKAGRERFGAGAGENDHAGILGGGEEGEKG